MNRLILFIPLMSIALVVLLVAGCDKERIVESTEIVREIEYIELPPDTVIIYDTVVTFDSVTIQATDTLTVYDTVVQTNTIHDTVIQINTIYDTVIVTITDTVTTVFVQYDTTIVTDTVVLASNEANELLAKGALEFYVDPLILEFAYQRFGLNDGWVYYLSAWQMDFTRRSAGVYDIYGYIEYWALDWSGYYPFEFYYRLSHTGGDPADVTNWQLGEPFASPAGHNPGLKSVANEKQMTGSLLR